MITTFISTPRNEVCTARVLFSTALRLDVRAEICSMEITRAVRDYAAKLAEKERVSSREAVDLARKQGMEEKSEKFRTLGGQVYVEEG
jgi:hypothetical protein